MLGLLAFMYSCQIYAEVHPVLFKDDTSLYSNVYFGMGFDEFKSKIGSNIFECKDSTNKKLADIGCKVSFRFGGSGVSEAVVLFKGNSLLAVLGRVNNNLYVSVISSLNATYKDQPQTENRDERKGLFSNKISNEYSIWSYPDYLMLVSKFDIPKYVENGTNFLLAVESANDNFINYMKIESKKKSNINIQPKVANIDVAKLHFLNNETQTNIGERKMQPAVASSVTSEATGEQSYFAAGAITIGEKPYVWSESTKNDWISSLPTLRSHYENQRWKDLSDLVIKINHPGAYPYYFLASSAFMLGYDDAMEKYIDKARVGVTKETACRLCDGMDIFENMGLFKDQIRAEKAGESVKERRLSIVLSHPMKPLLGADISTTTKTKIDSHTKLSASINPSQTLPKSTVINRSLLADDLSYGAKKEQIKDKVAYCSTNDKFITGFRKSFPKYIVDEYCVGINLVNGVQSDTFFLLKDGAVNTVIHRTEITEFQKLSKLYISTLGSVPKNRQQYKSAKSMECFNESGLVDYVELCKQVNTKYQYFLASESSTDLSSVTLNRPKLMGMLNAEDISKTPNIAQAVKSVKISDQSAIDVKSKTDINKKLNNKDVKSNKNSWQQEPSSFLGIILNEPLNASVQNKCALQFNEILKTNVLDGANMILPCHVFGDGELSIFLERRSTAEINVYGKRVSPLFALYYVLTNDGSISGKVEKIDVNFKSSSFDELKNILILKYGLPKKQTIAKVKTKGGSEFDSSILDWQGQEVTVHVESLAEIKVDGGSIDHIGLISVTTKSFNEKLKGYINNSTQKAADSL